MRFIRSCSYQCADKIKRGRKTTKKSPFEHRYILDLTHDYVIISVHFCNVIDLNSLDRLSDFLKVRITPNKEILWERSPNAPFKDFIITAIENSLGEEITHESLNKIIRKNT